jgi:hypothetical protein
VYLQNTFLLTPAGDRDILLAIDRRAGRQREEIGILMSR